MELGIPDVTVGHWSDDEARTGCTVIRLPPETVASGEIRGGAPATREFALLDPSRTVCHVDAVVLTGGSAFGLASADGVVAALEQEGRGFPTRHGPVPIVVALGLYDLGVGDCSVRPNAVAGKAAFEACSSDPAAGAVGAGAGATIGKWRGVDHALAGGIGIHSAVHDDVVVTAIVANNSLGDIDDGRITAAIDRREFDGWPDGRLEDGDNTVIGVVVTNARLDASECQIVAQGAHDGLARAVFPPHMRGDGDAFVAAATGAVDAHVDEVRLLAVVAVEQAVRSSVGTIEG